MHKDGIRCLLFQLLPLLEDAHKQAEQILTQRLGSKIKIIIRSFLNEALISQITAIDNEKFRAELWYTSEELLEKTKKKDFTCFLVYLDENPVAFLYGYDDDFDPSWFFLDEIATRIEGRGIGNVLITLLLMYCAELDYRYVTLYTESSDDKGRPLKMFYEHIGFNHLADDPEKGTIMIYSIKEDKLYNLYKRVMFSKNPTS